MSDYVPSSPRLFRKVGRSFVLGLAALLLLAAVIPAPLGLPADPARPPNPAKSAWFLLWIQELVSWTTKAIYPVVAAGALLILLPWLPVPAVMQARWFPKEQRALGMILVAASAGVLVLTLVGLFLRGRDWSLVWPW
jgi:hypothetical protein